MSKYIAIDCERAILGILILAKDKREEIFAQLSAEDFGQLLKEEELLKDKSFMKVSASRMRKKGASR